METLKDNNRNNLIKIEDIKKGVNISLIAYDPQKQGKYKKQNGKIISINKKYNLAEVLLENGWKTSFDINEKDIKENEIKLSEVYINEDKAIRNRKLIQLTKQWTFRKGIPKSIRKIYSVALSLFRDFNIEFKEMGGFTGLSLYAEIYGKTFRISNHGVSGKWSEVYGYPDYNLAINKQNQGEWEHNLEVFKKDIKKELKHQKLKKDNLKGINTSTMITTKNIISEYPKIDQNILPKELDKKEFKFVEGSLDLYNDADGIKEYIDTFILKLNQIVSKVPEKKEKVKKQKIPVKQQAKTKRKPKAKFETGFKFKEEDGVEFEITKSEFDTDINEWNYYVKNLKTNTSMWIQEKFIPKKPKTVTKKPKTVTKTVTKTDKKRYKKKFKKGQKVELIDTSEDSVYQSRNKGTIERYSEFSKDKNSWMVYVTADKDESENWHYESSLMKATPDSKKVKIKGRKTKTKDTSKKVGNVDLQVTLIKSFALMQGKDKTKKQTLNLYKRIEKAATELKIRKTSKYANEIKYISDKLKDYYNNTEGDLETIISVSISEKKYNELHKIAYSERQKTSVMLIKRYVGMYGLKDADRRAENLIKAIRSAYNKGKITKDDMYYSKIKAIESNLEAYLLKSKDLHPTGFDLKGLAGIAGIKLPVPEKKRILEKKMIPEQKKKSEKPVKAKKQISGENKTFPTKARSVKIKKNNKQPEKIKGIKLPPGVISSNQLKKMEFETIPFKGEWKNLIGDPSKPFHIMIYGKAGMGKSTQSVLFARYIADDHKFNVLYLAKEEGIGHTIKKKFKRLNAFRDNIYLIENKLPNDLSYFDLLIIDSINELKMSPDELSEIQKNNPRLSTWQIFQVKKDGDFRGASEFRHLCQAEFICEEGYCHAEKNRFGGNEWVKIQDFKLNTKVDFKEEQKKEKELKEKNEKEKELKKKYLEKK